jgi:hypothetical protein
MSELREALRKLDYALNAPVENWKVDGHNIVRVTEKGLLPLIHDYAASPETLALVADALNFLVRQKTLMEAAAVLAAASAPADQPQEGLRKQLTQMGKWNAKLRRDQYFICVERDTKATDLEREYLLNWLNEAFDAGRAARAPQPAPKEQAK